MSINPIKDFDIQHYRKENTKNEADGKLAEPRHTGKPLQPHVKKIPFYKKNSYTPIMNSFSPLPLPSAPSSFSQLPKKISEAIGRLESAEDRALAKEGLFKTRSFDLPLPTAPSSSDQTVILWRGCGARQLVQVILHNSFSLTPDQEALLPSEEEARSQVAEQTNFPEFTEYPEVAERFGTNKFVAAFAVNSRYLAKGSLAENGFICRHDAPLQLVKWKEGRKLFSESEGAQQASRQRQAFREEQAKKQSPLPLCDSSNSAGPSPFFN